MYTYCPKCGARLKPGSTFCQNCGQRVDDYADTSYNQHITPPPVYVVPPVTPPAPSPELKAAADGLGAASLGFAKILLVLLLGLTATATALGVAGSLGAAAYAFYHFAAGSAISLPLFIAEAISVTSVSGWGLLFCGLAAILVAAILIALTGALSSCIKSVLRKNQ